jgi:alpha 1,3-glucosidase
LIPYWYTLARRSYDTGEPVVRPLWWEFSDLEIQDLETQIMLGDAIMVAPALSAQPSEQIVFPKSARWYDYRTFMEVDHGKVETGKVSAFIRGGKGFCVRKLMRKSVDLMVRDPYELVMALDGDGRSEGYLYFDDGHSFDFEHGDFVYRRFSFEDGVVKSEKFMEDDDWENKCFIRKITVIGFKDKMPATAWRNGRKLKMEKMGKAVGVTKLNLSVTEDWSVKFEFEP